MFSAPASFHFYDRFPFSITGSFSYMEDRISLGLFPISSHILVASTLCSAFTHSLLWESHKKQTEGRSEAEKDDKIETVGRVANKRYFDDGEIRIEFAVYNG